MKKESKPKIKITGKASTSGGGKNTPTLKLNQYGQPVKSKSSTKKNSPSLASQAGKVAGKVAGKAAGLAKAKVKADVKVAKKVADVAGKVAGKAAGAAKSKVKADIKVAKKVAGVAGKVAMAPVNVMDKVSTAGRNAIMNQLGGTKRNFRQVGKGDPLKNLKNIKKAKKK
jgi:hypothetical protein